MLAAPGPHPLVVVLDHLKPGFNVAKIFRSAEAFGAAAVHLVDVGPFDPSPSKGSFRKVPARFYESFDESRAELTGGGYRLFCLSPGAPTRLMDADLSGPCAFILGHEEFGLSFDPDDYPDIVPLSVPQFGQVQSLNVSIAASLVMYEFVAQRIKNVKNVSRNREE